MGIPVDVGHPLVDDRRGEIGVAGHGQKLVGFVQRDRVPGSSYLLEPAPGYLPSEPRRHRPRQDVAVLAADQRTVSGCTLLNTTSSGGPATNKLCR